ncbi:MAG: GNAT family N-acetyltransferase [Crocinitomicaceae bacterium]
MKVDFKIIAYDSEEWKKAVNLREEILRKPFGFTFTAQELEEERKHIQIIGLVNSEIIATAVLVPEKPNLKMQRVVVLDHLRNLNIGSKMMSFCEGYAKEEGYATIYCHARDSAVNFYSNNNYSIEGDFFNEDEIPHLKMKKTITTH